MNNIENFNIDDYLILDLYKLKGKKSIDKKNFFGRVILKFDHNDHKWKELISGIELQMFSVVDRLTILPTDINYCLVETGVMPTQDKVEKYIDLYSDTDFEERINRFMFDIHRITKKNKIFKCVADYSICHK